MVDTTESSPVIQLLPADREPSTKTCRVGEAVTVDRVPAKVRRRLHAVEHVDLVAAATDHHLPGGDAP